MIPCKTTASWVRVEASVLSKRSMASNYEFQLAELMVFAGQKNVALSKPVTVSSTGRREGATRKKEFLTDGFGPYQMDAGGGPKTIRFNSAYHTEQNASVTIDLNDIYPLTSIFLHCSDEDNSVPQAIPSEHLLPERMIVEGATQADFSDAVTLFEYHKKSIDDVGPIIMRNFPEARCRYVRLSALKYENSNSASFPALIFAEVEVFANGENVALNKTVDSPPKSTPGYFLTDGSNAHGLILPLREWMNQLARRHDLETERPLVIDELNRRYARQKINLQRALWLAALLAVATGFSFLINRMIRIKAILHVKERLAADMHDELGANTHAIGVLGDLARNAESREELVELLDRARVFTERSGTALRHCTNMLEANACEDPAADMQHSAQHLLADMEHEISFEGEALLKKLPPHKRMDLFFFYKECLSNIIRHSGATRASTCLKVTPEKLRLSVTDNGRGLTGKVPVSLKRRARLLGAQVTMARPAEGGLCIILQLKNRKWRLFK